MKLKRIISSLLIVLFILSLVGCSSKQETPQGENIVENKVLVLATTTSTKDSGLLDTLLPIFENKTGFEVDVISQGTGQALKTGELGDCDVVLVHARASEDEFVANGFGVNRKDVMYNDFVVVGSPLDPENIKGLAVETALQKLSESKENKFISRGDNSGTHKKELELWKEAGIEPAGDWYFSVNKGMGDTLIMTNELQGYTMTDRGTYLSMKDNLELEILVEGDQSLLNPYGIIAVNPDKHEKVNYEGAMALIEFITSEEGIQIINDFKVNGEQLFFTE